MHFQQLIETITPEIYANLKRAIEIGKWPDGRSLTLEQRELCLQAVIAYESNCVPEAERTGFIDRGKKAEGEMCGDDRHTDAQPDADTAEQTLKWM